MSCNNSLTAILKNCDDTNAGGIAKFYIAPAGLVTGTTETNGTITSIGLSGGTAAFVEFQFNKNSASYTEEQGGTQENGSLYYSVNTVIKLARREVVKRNSIALVSAGYKNLVIILKDANGLYWYQGLTNSANLIANTGGSGTVKADGSSYELTFLSEEPLMMPEVDPTIIAALLA